LKVAAAALAAGRRYAARQARGPERALRWKGERTLSNLLPSGIIIPSICKGNGRATI